MLAAERLSLRGVDLQILRGGAGPPLLLLHGLAPVEPDAPVLELLAAPSEIMAPTHPGFGHAPRPDDFETVYDLVRLYLDLLDHLSYAKVTLMGLSFGGWLAAEIAATCPHRLDKLVLVGAAGIKLSDR